MRCIIPIGCAEFAHRTPAGTRSGRGARAFDFICFRAVPCVSVPEKIFTVTPATPAFDPNGTPYSPEYGDVYHSADSGPGQARHVFLGGNDLPDRWNGQRTFTIVETGFGLG